MSIAARFEAALREAAGSVPDAPELLPARLSVACARTLDVDGAGLSLVARDGRRVPLGASSEFATCAERLQFTVGEGPCLTAQVTREPVFAVLADLRRRWEPFAEQLVRQTPYRAVVALPLREEVSMLGAVDLYFEDAAAVPRLDVFAAMAVGDLMTTKLSEVAVWSTWSVERGPDWLHGPSAERRAAVWEAMGVVGLHRDVDAPAALDMLRTTAVASGRTLDEVAADLLLGRLAPADLRAPEGAPRD